MTNDKVFWNDQHFLLLGLKPGKNPVPVKKFFDHVHPDDREIISESVKEAIENKSNYRSEFRIITARGETRLREGVAAYLRSTRTPGTAVLISDFLVEAAAYETALDHLLGQRYDVAAPRVIGPEERDPSRLPRRVRLRDANP